MDKRNASFSHLGEGCQSCASLLDSETPSESGTLLRHRQAANSAMDCLTIAARLYKARTVQRAGLVGHTGLWQRRWVRGMARIHTERVLERRGELAVVVLKSWLDVEQSSTAAGMVICWRPGLETKSDRSYGDLLPPEPTRPPQLPLRGNLTW